MVQQLGSINNMDLNVGIIYATVYQYTGIGITAYGTLCLCSPPDKKGAAGRRAQVGPGSLVGDGSSSRTAVAPGPGRVTHGGWQ